MQLLKIKPQQVHSL